MAKENIIIVPRWFLNVVEDTLRIQNNINLDKETGETCQDRNIRQSLNGVRKLLNGEELTGMERFEKLQPSLPSNLDEAAQKVEDYYDVGEERGYLCCHRGDIKDAFKAGAEWQLNKDSEKHYFVQLKNIKDAWQKLKKSSPETGSKSVLCFYKGAEWMAEQGAIKYWMAKDKDDSLLISNFKPYRRYNGYLDTDSFKWINISPKLSRELFPDIKLDDSPVEVIVQIRKK